jgi:hypothetical protein
MATLFPEAAMRPNRPADPLSCVDMDEKVSVYVVSSGLVDFFAMTGYLRNVFLGDAWEEKSKGGMYVRYCQ